MVKAGGPHAGPGNPAEGHGRRMIEAPSLVVATPGKQPGGQPSFKQRTSSDGVRVSVDVEEHVQPVASTSRTGSPQHEQHSPILDRRKALAQVAFVRHSTSELTYQLRGSMAEGTLGGRHPRCSLVTPEPKLPGHLYNHDRMGPTPPKPWTTGTLPSVSASITLPASYAYNSASNSEGGPFIEANLNGIGHPVVLRNHRSASGAAASTSGSAGGGELVSTTGAAGLAQFLSSAPPAHHFNTQRPKLPALSNPPKANASTPSTSDTGEGDRSKGHGLRRLDTLPARSQAPPPPVAIAKPLGQDTLNLWRGKRLTRLEMRVEQRLHVVRNNPVAKTDLQSRVHSYIEEKVQEQAERVALAELAAERREQKTLEFVGNRLKGGKQGGGGGGGGGGADLGASLFDRATGKPRDDSNPLPDGSLPFWTGFLGLAQKLGQLREQLQQRALQRKEYQKQLAASTTIQRHWRGFRDRRTVHSLRNGDAAPVTGIVLVGPPTRAMQDEAAAKVWAFLEWSHNAAILKYLHRRFKERSGEMVAGNVASAFLSAEKVRSFRVQIKIGQWAAVEERCLDLVKKRMRSQIIGELDVPESKPPAAPTSQSGTKGLIDTETTIKVAVEEALAKVATTDRVILEDLRPVPKPVKMATLQVFMQERLQAYIAQLGVYWKKRARFIAQTRTAALRAKAIGVITNSYSGEDPEPPTPGGTRRVHANTGEQQAAAELAAQLEKDTDVGDIVDPGPFPRYRCMLTFLELKAVMQQGVAETPHFKSYLMRQKLQAYENELTQELTHRYAQQDEIKHLAVALPQGHDQQGQPAQPPSPQKGQKDGSRTKSFTLALLLHRWHTECNPRLRACLKKRYELMNITLLGSLMHGKFLPHDDMGHKLMELREG